MRKDIIDYINIIEKLRADEFYDIFSDEELIEIIDENYKNYKDNKKQQMKMDLN